MRWNNRVKVERPEYPKMVPVMVEGDKALELLTSLVVDDPRAELVDAGERGVYVRVHNEAADTAAKQYGSPRSFPLA